MALAHHLCYVRTIKFYTLKALVVLFTLFIFTVFGSQFRHNIFVDFDIFLNERFSPEFGISLASLWRLLNSRLVNEKGSVKYGKVVAHQTKLVHLGHFIL